MSWVECMRYETITRADSVQGRPTAVALTIHFPVVTISWAEHHACVPRAGWRC